MEENAHQVYDLRLDRMTTVPNGNVVIAVSLVVPLLNEGQRAHPDAAPIKTDRGVQGDHLDVQLASVKSKAALLVILTMSLSWFQVPQEP